MVTEISKICTKCHIEKPLSSFQINRTNKPNPYRFNYCKDCRKKQMYENLNNNLESFLIDCYRRLVVRSKKYQIPISISKEEFIDIYKKQNGKCFYTDVEMICKVGFGKYKNSLSVDKIVPEKGYVAGNIVLCCNRINMIKSDMTLDEMKKWTPEWHDRITRLVKI